jgi:hypothetical protein
MHHTYAENIVRRRSFSLLGYRTLEEVGLDGAYVSPLQILSKSATGPVLVAYNWFDAPSALRYASTLRTYGYMPGIAFNVVLEKALALVGMTRADVYMTQAFHLLPEGRSDPVPFRDVDLSFDAITKHEVQDRRVIALGG